MDDQESRTGSGSFLANRVVEVSMESIGEEHTNSELRTRQVTGLK